MTVTSEKYLKDWIKLEFKGKVRRIRFVDEQEMKLHEIREQALDGSVWNFTGSTESSAELCGRSFVHEVLDLRLLQSFWILCRW